MTQAVITAGDATAPGGITGGNDGTLNIVVGPNGGKITALAIDAAGNLKSTALAAPAFSATQTAVQSIPTATFTVLVLDTKVFDTATAYSTSTGRFTPQVAGYYQIQATYVSSQTAGGVVSEILKNGTRVAVGEGQFVGGIGTSCCSKWNYRLRYMHSLSKLWWCI
jgi:hypothetical protein